MAGGKVREDMMMRFDYDYIPIIRNEFFHRVERFFPPLSVAKTPFEIIDKHKKLNFKTIRYMNKGDKEPALLFIPHIINRPYILDLSEDVSVIRVFSERNFEVYMVDWGYPRMEHKNISFSDYEEYVDNAVNIISKKRKKGGKEGGVAIFGYCTGGIISLIYAALHPEKVKKLILLVTPVDFSMWYDPRILWGKMFDVRRIAGFFGNVPGELINFIGFLLLLYHIPIFSWHKEFIEEFLTYESWKDALRRVRWIIDAQMLPGSAYTEFIDGCYNKNLLINNKMKIDSELVDLRKISSPLLNILAKYDHIVPPEAGKALKDVYSGEKYEEFIFPASHVGLSVSEKAHKKLWPRVCEWLESG